MKNFQQNLLILLAIALCALCAWQWQGEARQRVQTESLVQQLQEKLVAIQGYTNSIKTLDGQVAQMDARIAELKATVKTNNDLLVKQKIELNAAEAQNGVLTNELEQYKVAVTNLEDKLKEAYAGVKKQNAAIEDLVKQRDDFVQKLNDSVKDRNNVVAKYNELAAQFEKLQGTAKPGNK